MKKIIVILSLIIFCNSCITLKKTPDRWYSVNEQKKRFKIKEADDFEKLITIPKQPDIYRLDKDVLQFLGKSSSKKYIGLYTFTRWASDTQKQKIGNIIQKYDNDSVQLFLLSTDDWTQRDNTKQYLKDIQYPHNIFMLDIDKYGISFNPNKKVLNFLTDIDSDCVVKTGLHIVILFNSQTQRISIE